MAAAAVAATDAAATDAATTTTASTTKTTTTTPRFWLPPPPTGVITQKIGEKYCQQLCDMYLELFSEGLGLFKDLHHAFFSILWGQKCPQNFIAEMDS